MSKETIEKKKIDTIDVSSKRWTELVEVIVNEFDIGQLIAHDWLREQFEIKPLMFRDFPDMETIRKAIADQQFIYMGLFERLRSDVLKSYSLLLVNVRGLGYSIIHPKDQTTYAYDHLVADLKKSFKEASDIMTYVKTVNIDEEQKAKDRQLFSKMGSLKQLFFGFSK